jgi:hypothetical protein
MERFATSYVGIVTAWMRTRVRLDLTGTAASNKLKQTPRPQSWDAGAAPATPEGFLAKNLEQPRARAFNAQSWQTSFCKRRPAINRSDRQPETI